MSGEEEFSFSSDSGGPPSEGSNGKDTSVGTSQKDAPQKADSGKGKGERKSKKKKKESKKKKKASKKDKVKSERVAQGGGYQLCSFTRKVLTDCVLLRCITGGTPGL